MLAKIWLPVRSERKVEIFLRILPYFGDLREHIVWIWLFQIFFPQNLATLAQKFFVWVAQILFFWGQEAKIQKFKKKKNCIIKVWGGQFYTGKCKFYTGEWGAAKFLHARMLPLKCRMTSHVGILFCKIPLLRVSLTK